MFNLNISKNKELIPFCCCSNEIVCGFTMHIYESKSENCDNNSQRLSFEYLKIKANLNSYMCRWKRRKKKRPKTLYHYQNTSGHNLNFIFIFIRIFHHNCKFRMKSKQPSRQWIWKQKKRKSPIRQSIREKNIKIDKEIHWLKLLYFFKSTYERASSLYMYNKSIHNI